MKKINIEDAQALSSATGAAELKATGKRDPLAPDPDEAGEKDFYVRGVPVYMAKVLKVNKIKYTTYVKRALLEQMKRDNLVAADYNPLFT